MPEAMVFEQGSENVFEDLGFPDAEERLAKAALSIRIAETIRTRKLTQKHVAELLAIDQPKVSRLLRGKLAGFSTQRLMHFLNLLGQDVDIIIKPAVSPRQQGQLRVIETA